MKRTFLLLLGMIMTLGAAAQGKVHGWISDADGYVNVRKGASVKSAVARRLNSGQEVYVSPTTADWYAVSLTPMGPNIGYVYWNRVQNYIDETMSFVVSDKDGRTNVRQQATTKSRIVKTMRNGEEFRGTWTYVGGETGRWIAVFESGNKERLIGFVYNTNVTPINTDGD